MLRCVMLRYEEPVLCCVLRYAALCVMLRCVMLRYAPPLRYAALCVIPALRYGHPALRCVMSSLRYAALWQACVMRYGTLRYALWILRSALCCVTRYAYRYAVSGG